MDKRIRLGWASCGKPHLSARATLVLPRLLQQAASDGGGGGVNSRASGGVELRLGGAVETSSHQLSIQPGQPIRQRWWPGEENEVKAARPGHGCIQSPQPVRRHHEHRALPPPQQSRNHRLERLACGANGVGKYG